MPTVQSCLLFKEKSKNVFCFPLQERQNLGILRQLKAMVKVLRHFVSREMV